MGPAGRCLQRRGAAVRFPIGDAYEALSCICPPWLDAGRSGSPPRSRTVTSTRNGAWGVACNAREPLPGSRSAMLTRP